MVRGLQGAHTGALEHMNPHRWAPHGETEVPIYQSEPEAREDAIRALNEHRRRMREGAAPRGWGSTDEGPDITHQVTPDQLHTVVGREVADKLMREGKEAPVSITEEPAEYKVDRQGRESVGRTVHRVRIGDTVVSHGATRDEAEAEAQRIVKEHGIPRELRGVDLRVGGEGMKGFYDKILTDYANKLGKPFGAKVGKTHIKGPTHAQVGESPYEYVGGRRQMRQARNHEVHHLKFTPEMKQQLREQPQFMFSERGRETSLVLKARPVKGYTRREGGKVIVVAPHIDPRDPAHQKQQEFRAVARETDTKLGDIWQKMRTIGEAIGRNTQRLKERGERRNANPQDYFMKQLAEEIEGLKAQREALAVEAAPLNEIYAKHRWSRFYLVTNENGHVHSTTACSTTFPTTRWAWLPELSGAKEQEAVAEYGEKMCTICFPSAPTEMRRLGTRGRVVEQEAGAKQAARDLREQKREEKAKKNIRPDGEPLRIRAGHVHESIQTIVTARRYLVEWLYDAHVSEGRAEGSWARDDEHRVHLRNMAAEYREAAKQVLGPLAARTGENAETLWAEAETKAAKKYRTGKSENTLVLKARLTPKQHMKRIQAALRPEDRKPEYRGHPHCLGGHCYVAAEALYHTIGREKSGYVPTHVQHEGSSHWFLRHRTTGEVLDPTAAQFKTPVPYERGRGIGFQGKDPSVPSERARRVLARLVSKAEAMPEMSAPQHAAMMGQGPGVQPMPKTLKPTVVLKVRKPAEKKYIAPKYTPPTRAHQHAGEVYPEETGAHNTMSAFSKDFQKRVIDTAHQTLGVKPPQIQKNFEKIFLKAKAHPHYEADRTWYHTANKVGHDIADDHGYDPHQVIGALAAISSGSEWGMNQTIARDLAGHIKRDSAVDLSPEQHDALHADLKLAASKSIGKDPYRFSEIAKGTKLSQIDHPLAAAIAANHIRKAETGKKWQVGHGYDGIAKAVSIYRGAHPRTVLRGGKIRSFYNNMLDPDADQDLTIDTHMLNAAANRLITDKLKIGKASGSTDRVLPGPRRRGGREAAPGRRAPQSREEARPQGPRDAGRHLERVASTAPREPEGTPH